MVKASDGNDWSHQLLKRGSNQGRTLAMTRASAAAASELLPPGAPMPIPQNPNLRWSLDLVTDTLVSGRRVRILTLVDDFTKGCLGLVVDTSRPGWPAALRSLCQVAIKRGLLRADP